MIRCVAFACVGRSVAGCGCMLPCVCVRVCVCVRLRVRRRAERCVVQVHLHGYFTAQATVDATHTPPATDTATLECLVGLGAPLFCDQTVRGTIETPTGSVVFRGELGVQRTSRGESLSALHLAKALLPDGGVLTPEASAALGDVRVPVGATLVVRPLAGTVVVSAQACTTGLAAGARWDVAVVGVPDDSEKLVCSVTDREFELQYFGGAGNLQLPSGCSPDGDDEEMDGGGGEGCGDDEGMNGSTKRRGTRTRQRGKGDTDSGVAATDAPATRRSTRRSTRASTRQSSRASTATAGAKATAGTAKATRGKASRTTKGNTAARSRRGKGDAANTSTVAPAPAPAPQIAASRKKKRKAAAPPKARPTRRSRRSQGCVAPIMHGQAFACSSPGCGCGLMMLLPQSRRGGCVGRCAG